MEIPIKIDDWGYHYFWKHPNPFPQAISLPHEAALLLKPEVPGRNWWFGPGAWAGTGCQQDRSSEKTNCFQTVEPFFFALKDYFVKGNTWYMYSANSSRFSLVVYYSNIHQRHQLTAVGAYFGRYTTWLHVVSFCTTSEKFLTSYWALKKFLTSTKAKSSELDQLSPCHLFHIYNCPVTPEILLKLLTSWSPFHNQTAHACLFSNSRHTHKWITGHLPEIHHFFLDGRPGAGDTLRELPFTLPASRQKKRQDTQMSKQKSVSNGKTVSKTSKMRAFTKAFLETFFFQNDAAPNPEPWYAVAPLWHLVVTNLKIKATQGAMQKCYLQKIPGNSTSHILVILHQQNLSSHLGKPLGKNHHLPPPPPSMLPNGKPTPYAGGTCQLGWT